MGTQDLTCPKTIQVQSNARFPSVSEPGSFDCWMGLPIVMPRGAPLHEDLRGNANNAGT